MACFHPLTAYRSRERTEKGKYKIVFDRSQAYVDKPLTIPCGQCIGCRLERSRQWAIRCMHESQLYDDNCFLTLTYNDENLPRDLGLDHQHYQLFMKRLRKKYGKGIRYYMCGEYGDQFGRPHYHACIFNHDFHDKIFWKEKNGNRLYISQELDQLWSDENGPLGFATTGGVTFQSAAYVARYITKKVTGEKADDHYNWTDWDTGECHYREPEYTQQSRRPGIASDWLKKYAPDVYNYDFVVVNGKKMRPPKAYDRSYEVTNSEHLERLKFARVRDGRKFSADTTPERLAVREQCQMAKLNQLKRELK